MDGNSRASPSVCLPCWVLVTIPLALSLLGCDINKGVQFPCSHLLSGQVPVKQKDIREIFSTSQWPFKPAHDGRTLSRWSWRSPQQLFKPLSKGRLSLTLILECCISFVSVFLWPLNSVHPLSLALASQSRCDVLATLCVNSWGWARFFFQASWAAYCNSCLIYWPQSGKHSSLLGFT